METERERALAEERDKLKSERDQLLMDLEMMREQAKSDGAAADQLKSAKKELSTLRAELEEAHRHMHTMEASFEINFDALRASQRETAELREEAASLRDEVQALRAAHSASGPPSSTT